MATAVIFDKKSVVPRLIGTSKYPIAKINESKNYVKINEVLPFRVRFINIGIEAYGPNNIPPIGIAIVGINNYIL